MLVHTIDIPSPYFPSQRHETLLMTMMITLPHFSPVHQLKRKKKKKKKNDDKKENVKKKKEIAIMEQVGMMIITQRTKEKE